MAPELGRCRLPELLEVRGITRAEFARRLGVSEQMVSKYISGEKRLSLYRAKEAASILQCQIEDLYEWH